MRKTIFFVICFMVLFRTHCCYADKFAFDTEFQVSTRKDDQSALQIELRPSINFRCSNLYLTLGLKKLIWGVGQTGTLALSPTSPTIPVFQYQIKLDKIHYCRFMSPLEKDKKRWLFGHRIEGRLEFLEVGIWELMLCSDDVFSGYFFSVPLLPLYAIQHLGYKVYDHVYDHNSNAMLGMDFKYITDFSEVYGELVIDDFPQKSEYGNPKKVGGLFGIKYSLSDQFDIWGEYVRINNFVYTHKNSSNRYLYENKPFGHWLGMDSDLWAIGLNQIINKDTRIFWQIDSIRKGEGDYTDDWNIDYGRKYEFLTGVIEESLQVQGKVEYIFSENLQLSITAVIGHSNNANHLTDVSLNYSDIQINFKIKYL